MPKKAVDVLNEPFPQDKAVYTTRKKTCKGFFQKNAKKFCVKFPGKFTQNFHVWPGFCLYDNPASQKGYYFIVFIFIYTSNRTQLHVIK